MEYAVQDEVNYISVEANAGREFLWARCLILPDASTPDHRLSPGRKGKEKNEGEREKGKGVDGGGVATSVFPEMQALSRILGSLWRGFVPFSRLVKMPRGSLTLPLQDQ